MSVAARLGAALLALAGAILFAYLALVGLITMSYGLTDGAESGGDAEALIGVLAFVLAGAVGMAVGWLGGYALTGRTLRLRKRHLVAALALGPVVAGALVALLILLV